MIVQVADDPGAAKAIRIGQCLLRVGVIAPDPGATLLIEQCDRGPGCRRVLARLPPSSAHGLDCHVAGSRRRT